MTLWKIDQDIQKIMDEAVDPETGEISEEVLEQLEDLQIARDAKLENVALAYKNYKSFAEQIKAEKQALEKRQKQAERQAEWLKDYMARSLKGEEFKTPSVAVSYRQSSTIEVYDMGALPDEYLKYKDPEVDKTKIRAAIKDGVEVPGAVMVNHTNMSIK